LAAGKNSSWSSVEPLPSRSTKTVNVACWPVIGGRSRTPYVMPAMTSARPPSGALAKSGLMLTAAITGPAASVVSDSEPAPAGGGSGPGTKS
jgi:hypothetical protein